MTKSEKNNVLNFPSNLSQTEREVEALLFAAAEPLDIETIQAKITKVILGLSLFLIMDLLFL